MWGPKWLIKVALVNLIAISIHWKTNVTISTLETKMVVCHDLNLTTLNRQLLRDKCDNIKEPKWLFANTIFCSYDRKRPVW
jgi:hypothetical protein